jgi:hypothetical protein
MAELRCRPRRATTIVQALPVLHVLRPARRPVFTGSGEPQLCR